MVFGALTFLMFLTVGVATIPLGPFNIVVALAIAITKAVLIMLFFMHVKYSSKLTWVFVVGAFIWLGLMVVLVSMDFASRGMQTYGTHW
jgi:cytochrome c oxidase subunit 4